MAVKTYYYKSGGGVALQLPSRLRSGVSHAVTLPTCDNPFIAITLDEVHKPDLDEAMADLGFGFVAEGNGKERVITAADSPYTPREELLILADASSGPIDITVQPISSFLIATRQIKIVKVDGTANPVSFTPAPGDLVNGLTSYLLDTQYAAMEVLSGTTQWHLLLQPSAPAPVSGISVVTTDTLVAGDIVAFDNSSPAQTVLANPSLSLSPPRYEARGIAMMSAPAGTLTIIHTIPGQRVPVRFVPSMLWHWPLPPAANGSRVFLSTTPGRATLSPNISPGNALVLVGILVGADGITLTPDVVFQFQLISINP